MAPESRDTFADALKRLRLAAGLTQEALAERAGISAKAVSDLERGFGRSPRLTTVTLLADALRLDPDQRARLLASARPDRAPATRSGSEEIPHPALPRPL
ncbi:MAG TPA: helix-turn-helix transcriptional regulator, partial [Thermomicrobiales bacterium]|nr:helix-turn-helix transcriptional regulator [Thermomicrobiales bacterium]